MVKRKEEEKVLDVNATMQGTLRFSDPVKLRINGKFEGTLTTKGTLIIGEGAHVTADIVGENISVAGRVKGNMRATKVIDLKPTAVVFGDMETPRLSIELGASFNGKSRMSEGKMSLEELSDYLSIDEDKIMEWVNGGRIPVERKEEGLMFDRQEVETWIGRNA
ncbi:MAG: polymer-forming cytoskeletal protein [Candidatus Omnitrophota bacterium]|nr:MAG: polymer-forming cytoskeletal protein [Candidatus Omnitrophota bacterium]